MEPIEEFKKAIHDRRTGVEHSVPKWVSHVLFSYAYIKPPVRYVPLVILTVTAYYFDSWELAAALFLFLNIGIFTSVEIMARAGVLTEYMECLFSQEKLGRWLWRRFCKKID